MNKEAPRKGVFITIIVLLVIFAPLSIISFVLHLMEGKENPSIVENENHEFAYQGKLYFYDEMDSLVGTYECQNPGIYCNFAESTLDHNIYALDSYSSIDLKTSLIQNRYAFLIDGTSKETANPFLYDLKTSRVLVRYSSINNYGIGIENNRYIVKSLDSKYGVIDLSGEVAMPIPMEYDFLGLANVVNEDAKKIIGDIYAGYQNGFWYLVGENGAVLTEKIDRQIVTYNGQQIITKDEMGYYVIDYKNQELLNEGPYLSLSFTGKYLNVMDQYNDFYVYDINTQTKLTETLHVKNTDIVTSRINESGKLEVLQNGSLVQSVAIS